MKKYSLEKRSLDIRKHGFLKVPRVAFMALYEGTEMVERRSANVYIHLLFRACYIPKKEVCGQEVVQLQRGEMVFSKKQLADLFDFSRSVLNKVLLRLERYGLVEMEAHRRYTLFRITDYNEICGRWVPLSVEREKQRRMARREVAGLRSGSATGNEPVRSAERERRFEEWRRQHGATNKNEAE